MVGCINSLQYTDHCDEYDDGINDKKAQRSWFPLIIDDSYYCDNCDGVGDRAEYVDVPSGKVVWGLVDDLDADREGNADT